MSTATASENTDRLLALLKATRTQSEEQAQTRLRQAQKSPGNMNVGLLRDPLHARVYLSEVEPDFKNLINQRTAADFLVQVYEAAVIAEAPGQSPEKQR